MAVPAFIDSQTQDSGGATTITFDMSTITHTTDDFLIAFVKQSENTAAQEWDDDGGGGNGWTRIAYNRTTGGRDQETAVYYKFATSASEADPTFDWDSGGTNEPMSGALLVYRGVDKVDPYTEITWQWAQNDANPPNPNVRIDYANTRVVCCHNATHDDISTVAAPTGFTLRTQVWNGTADDHRNHFTADIEVDTIGTYSPPDWQHSVLNTTPEYQTYSIALNEARAVHLTSPAENTKFQWSDTNKTVSGDGFEASQGAGKLEIWSDLTGTTKTIQSIDSWSDTSIQFDFTQGSLVDGVNYLVVTNDSGEVSNKRRILIGFGPYEPWAVTDADHYWKMDNAYTDEAARGGAKPFNQNQVGPPDFISSPVLTRNTTYSFRIDAATERTRVADSEYTNTTNTHAQRNIGGWVRFANNQNIPATFYEEGGGVNNYYFMLEPNGRLVANVADEGDFKAQKSADFQLALNRTYHVMIHHNQATKEFDVYVDGVKQTSPLAGSLGTASTMAAHSGDWSFGNADSNLDTGGVDIAYSAVYTMYYSHWGTWSNTGGGAPLTATQIRDELFRSGALAEHTISTGTEAAMQAAIDNYDSQTHADVPLTYEIENVTGGGDLELTIIDQVWPDEVKFHVRWLGTGKLTIRNSGTSNFDTAKAWSPVAGTFAVIATAPVQVTVKDITDNTAIQNARVRIEADTGGPLSAGTVILEGLTNASGVLTGELDYTASQPIVGTVRQSTTPGSLYKPASIAGTIGANGYDETILMVPDE